MQDAIWKVGEWMHEKIVSTPWDSSEEKDFSSSIETTSYVRRFRFALVGSCEYVQVISSRQQRALIDVNFLKIDIDSAGAP